MTTKQAIQHFFIRIIEIIIIITVMSFDIKPLKHEWLIYVLYFGQGIIAGYLLTVITSELEKFFNLK